MAEQGKKFARSVTFYIEQGGIVPIAQPPEEATMPPKPSREASKAEIEVSSTVGDDGGKKEKDKDKDKEKEKDKEKVKQSPRFSSLTKTTLTSKFKIPSKTGDHEAAKKQDSMSDILSDVRQASKEALPEELILQLKGSLADCSRQRLRALLMGLRKNGNYDNRITVKELNNVLTEYQVKVGAKLIQDLVERYSDQYGVDYERMHLVLVEAHSRTGRDSVVAMRMNNHKGDASKEHVDDALVKRLAEQMAKDLRYDMMEMRQAFEAWSEKSSKDKALLSKGDTTRLVQQHQLPVYGAPLNVLMDRCTVQDKIEWESFVSLLERAHRLNEDLWLNHKSRDTTSVQPSESQPVEADSVQLEDKPTFNRGDSILSSGSREAQEDSRKSSVSSKLFGKAFKESSDSLGSSKSGESPVKGSMKGRLFGRKTSAKDLLAAKPEPIVEEKQAPPPSPAPPPKPVARHPPEALPLVYSVKGKEVVIWPPDAFKSSASRECGVPTAKLQLDWVYGFRGTDTRRNIGSLTVTGELLYCAGAVVVLYNMDKQRQRFYLEHTSEVRALAVHPNGNTIATGQAGSKDSRPLIKLWRGDTNKTLMTLGDKFFEQSVYLIVFSRTGDRLLAGDGATPARVSIWNSVVGELIAAVHVDTEQLCDCGICPKDDAILATMGKEHFQFWKVDEQDKTIAAHVTPSFEKHMKARYVHCHHYRDNGDLLTGDSNGTVYVWPYGSNTIAREIKHAHNGPVYAITVFKSILVTAGRDGKVYGWTLNRNFDHAGLVEVPQNEGSVRAVTFHKEWVVVGTSTNSIFAAKHNEEGPSPLNSVILDQVVTVGHSDDLRCVLTPPNPLFPHHFIMAGPDGIVTLVNCNGHQIVWRHCIKGAAIAAFDTFKSLDHLLLGTKDGNIILMEKNAADLYLEATRFKLPVKASITLMKLSPDELFCAVGLADGSLYVVHTDLSDRTVEVSSKYKEHGASISSLDWSTETTKDAYLIRSTSTDGGLIHYMVTEGAKLSSMESVANKTWASNECLYAFHAIGSHRSGKPEVVAVTGDDQFVVAGDEDGGVYLFTAPCSFSESPALRYRHHGCCTRVLFTQNKEYLITAGGDDGSILQWRIIR